MYDHTPSSDSAESSELSNTHFARKERNHLSLEPSTKGALLGVAIGDALGLPVETWTADRIREEVGRVTDYLPVEHNPFLSNLPAGTTSDDTQLTLALCRSLSRRQGIDLDDIAAEQAKEVLKNTLGWGGSTKESLLKVASGTPWHEAAITENPKRGTGNGVAMKVAPLGIYLALTGKEMDDHLDDIANIAIMTHRTSMAISSAFAQVAAVHECMIQTPDSFSAEQFLDKVTHYSMKGRSYLPETATDDDLTSALVKLKSMIGAEDATIIEEFDGGGCYVFQSLPFSYAFFLRNPESIDSLFDVTSAGGDTDSNASMVGSLLGALNGPEIFPEYLQVAVEDFSEVLESAQNLVQGFSE